MNYLNRFLIVFVLMFVFNVRIKAQNLSLYDLQTMLNKTNWVYVNEYLLGKGWEYYESKKGNSTQYNTITWSFNKGNYSDKAQSWLYLSTYDNSPNNIEYIIINKESFALIQNSLSANNFKLTNSRIEDSQVISTYSNNKYTLTISTGKWEMSDLSSQSITGYSIKIIKKAGVCFTVNEKKNYKDDTPYHPTCNIGHVKGKKLDYRYGGVVFYIFQKGDAGYVSGETHGLVCATKDQGEVIWGCNGIEIIGAYGTAIGTGAQNTTNIVTVCKTAGSAADICANLSLNGYCDWFLPSIEELNLIYQNKEAINVTAIANGGSSFASAYYWSSTMYNEVRAWGQALTDGIQHAGYGKFGIYYVRAIRAF